jgi:hypothetical protein
MESMGNVGRMLIAIGLVCVVAGVVTMLAERVGIKLGRLPGDIAVRGKSGWFYFPVVTCVLVSLVLTLLSWFLRRR